MPTTQRKAKRVLKDITFDHAGSHLALCSATQGAANERNQALVLKGANFSKEAIEKMQAVKVTLSIPEFLKRFFGLWYEDAEVLAAMMGYVEPPEDAGMEVQDWVAEKLQSFEIIKSLHEATDLNAVLAGLSEDQYLSYLQDQEALETVFKALDKASKESDKAPAESDNSTTASVEKTVEASASGINKGNLMPKDVKSVEQTVTVEMVEKSALEVVQKALDDQKVQLEKAMQTIAAFEQEKKEQIVKAKTAKIQAVIKSDKQLAVVLKAALALEEEKDFEALVEVLSELQSQIEKSALFQEQGAAAPDLEQKQEESAVAKILKSQFSK